MFISKRNLFAMMLIVLILGFIVGRLVEAIAVGNIPVTIGVNNAN